MTTQQIEDIKSINSLLMDMISKGAVYREIVRIPIALLEIIDYGNKLDKVGCESRNGLGDLFKKYK